MKIQLWPPSFEIDTSLLEKILVVLSIFYALTLLGQAWMWSDNYNRDLLFGCAEKTSIEVCRQIIK